MKSVSLLPAFVAVFFAGVSVGATLLNILSRW